MDQGTHEAAPPIAWASDALRDVAAERRRQIEAEGWTPEHDDQHSNNTMSIAAACYALAGTRIDPRMVNVGWLWQETGWASTWFKPKSRRNNLIRAAALLVAEIERLDRADSASRHRAAASWLK